MGADDVCWRNVRLVDVHGGGGDGGAVASDTCLCRQVVHLLQKCRRDDGVSGRNHGVRHDAETHGVTIRHQCEGQTC